MLGTRDSYFIKPGYTIRAENLFFDDTPYKDEFQKPVYEYARQLADRSNFRRILDLGCGSGFKLIKFFGDCETIGVDLEPTVGWLKKQYPNRKWQTVEGSLFLVNYDLLICADVIEHVPLPNTLLWMMEVLNPKSIILSTPARELLNLGTEDGPPRNPHHVREWTQEEFAAYIGSRFEIVKHFVVDGATQVIECKPRC